MFISCSTDSKMVGRAVEKIREHRGWYIFEALLFIIIGVMALSMPEITAITFEFLLATLFIIGGTIRFLNGIVMPYHRWWQIISGLIYAITGAMIFTWPITGLSALLIAVGALLFTEGVFEIGIALALRPAKNWKWMLLAGITSIMLAMLIIIGFPYAGIMFIAIAMGLSFMFYGVSVLAIALKCKKQTSSKKETGHENLRS